jgi:hypothetical protein
VKANAKDKDMDIMLTILEIAVLFIALVAYGRD